MAPGLPARMVILCAVYAGAGTARAETRAEIFRRKVAVIDLSGESAAGGLRVALYRELLDHWALGPVGNSSIDALLEGKLGDDDEDQRIELARARRDAADAAVLDSNFQGAQDNGNEGQKYLLEVTPTHASVALLADLELARAIGDLGTGHPADAAAKFALAYRLNPDRTLDPARYVQEAVDAFEAAKKAAMTTTMLEVHGTGHVWIDGKALGQAPGSFEVVAGDHLVQLAGPDRQTIGIEVVAPRSSNAPVEIADAPASTELMIKRARLALSRVPDAAARSAAMQRLAQLLDVHDAVLITKNDDGKLVVQTWKDHECPLCLSVDPGFSKPTEHRDEQPIDLLAPLAPPKPPEINLNIKPPPFVLPPIVVEKQWYERRWVQGSIATGAIAAVVGAILWARHTTYLGFNPNTQFDTISR